MVYNAFFRAAEETPDPENARGVPWPDIPVEVEGAVIVGRIGQSEIVIWHAITQNRADFVELQAMPGFFASSYALLKNHVNGPDVFEAIVEVDDPENPGETLRRRVKMRDKPGGVTVAEDVIPHQFAGLSA